MIRLFVTRHGETDWNRQRRLQGWKDSELTETGINNAIALGHRLRDIRFQSVYVSSSTRTIKTAELIIGDRNFPMIIDDCLREIHLGEWEGQTQEFLEKEYPKEFNAFWNTPHLYQSETGESFAQLQERVQKALKRILAENDEGNILVVTHTVFIKSLLAHFKQFPLEKLWSPPFIYDTSLTIIEVDTESKITLEGDITHLSKGVL